MKEVKTKSVERGMKVSESEMKRKVDRGGRRAIYNDI
jgi:hypothetical protein